MVDLRSHRTCPYEHHPVLRRTGSRSSPSSPTLSKSPMLNGQHNRGEETSPSLRSPFRNRLRTYKTSHKQQQQQQQRFQEQKYCFASDVENSDNNQEMMAMEVDVDANTVNTDEELAQESPAIFRLSPELLALIFHYVYVTPVVHIPQNEQQKQHHDDFQENLTSRQPSLSSSASTSSTSSISSLFSNTSSTATSQSNLASSTSGARQKKEKRKSAIYIQNDLSSMLALCLTCRTFYPQAVRMLWRQRTLADYDELVEFYQAIDFSASLRKRHQKQRQIEQQSQRPGMGYAAEEGFFNNEAALRIKSLTLLDMSLGSTLPLGDVTDVTSPLTSRQFFGSSSTNHNNPMSAGANLDLCRGIDMLPKGNGDSSSNAYPKDTTVTSSSSVHQPSSSSSSSSSGGVLTRRRRQKTTSIYSEIISPRLLQTIANYCFALVDLSICIDSKQMSLSNIPGLKTQPSIPFSILAGTLLSLKRLTLMGLVCDPKRNKTGSELLMFAQNIQPLERISIRSCKGISVETYIEFAVRSHGCLESLDYQGLDFESSQQLTDMMSAYACHCKNIKSVTLSCLNALSLDGMMETLAHYGATELQELHVLGHDSFHVQQEEGAPAAQPQQIGVEGGPQVTITQMCHLSDAAAALSNLSKLSLRRLTLYCPGITDFALFEYIRHSKTLVDLVLNEPTTILQHPHFQAFVKSYLPQTPDAVQQELEEEENIFGPPVTTSTPQFTSAGFFGLIFNQCPWLKYMFMKLSLETAQEWIMQPCFKEAGLDKCLYQYRTATGAPAVVLMWDTRNKIVKA
ncbi:hypothetical protein BGZ46_009252 [Entomortierella lignicola]|nr:hypothetical protein BGZ46_009252 [Entomortierella lignicola]